MDDFLGAKPMPTPDYLGRPLMPSEVGNAPIRLEQDDQGRWVIMLNDGNRIIESVLPEAVVDQIAERITTARLLEDNGLQFQVTAVAYEMMGAEGAAFIRKPVRHDPTESLQSVAMRAFDLANPYGRHHPGDRLEIQVIEESIPKPPKPGHLDF